jgi:hypothetical protein
MTDLVTMAQARDHLRNYYDAEENDIAIKITQASAIVLDYIKAPVPTQWDVVADNVPPVIQAAVLLTVGWLYEDRSGGLNPDATRAPIQQDALGYLPPSITDILHRYRDPALA